MEKKKETTAEKQAIIDIMIELKRENKSFIMFMARLDKPIARIVSAYLKKQSNK